MMEIEVWQLILYIVLALIGGGVAGFFIAKTMLSKQIKDNPPINEKMIRAMVRSMGRTPSEKQVREVMKNVNSQR